MNDSANAPDFSGTLESIRAETDKAALENLTKDLQQSALAFRKQRDDYLLYVRAQRRIDELEDEENL